MFATGRTRNPMRIFLLILPAVAAGLIVYQTSVPQAQSPAPTTPSATEQSKTQWMPLLNGKDLEGWTIVPANTANTTNTTWSVQDGKLICAGTPVGYIRTVKEYTSFELELEWRFDPKLGAGNSGVLLRVVGADQVWPKSIEAQLESRSAGDIWNIGEFPMQAQASRTEGRHTTKEHATNEKPLGEWNKYSIRLDGGRLELRVNGLLQNVADHCEVVAGKIALQSEGSHIEFREIKIRPLPAGR